MSATLRIAFICSGNICRSPMAHVLAERELERRGRPALVISAGTLHLNGRAAASEARAAIAEVGLDLNRHRSQGAHPGLLRYADHLIVMEEHHARKLLAKAPELAPRIVRLWAFYDGPDAPLTGIDDPIGQGVEAFRVTRDIIQNALEGWLDHIGVPAPAPS